MEFELSEDQLELQEAVRTVLGAEAPPSLAHAISEAYETLSVETAVDRFWATLVELDWPAMALPTQVGGLGYGWVELAVVVEELGRHAAPGPFVATVTQYAQVLMEVATPVEAKRLLTQVVTGEVTGAFAMDEGAGTWDTADVAATARRDGDQLVLAGTKYHVLDGATAEQMAVVVRLDGLLRVLVVPSSALQVTEVEPIDAGVRHATVSLDGVRVPSSALVGSGDAQLGVQRALEGSVVAVAAVTLGACQRIFDIDNDYAKQRVQFGVPIGSFQAVKHKLVDMYRDIQRARALVYYAASTLAEDHPNRTLAASMAKAGAGEAQRRCVRDGLQLAGGIGYTRENDLHLFLRRAMVGELHFGSSSQHRRKVARLAMAGADGSGP